MYASLQLLDALNVEKIFFVHPTQRFPRNGVVKPIECRVRSGEMNSRFNAMLVCLSAVLLAIGCQGQEPDTSADDQSSVTACEIALTPHDGAQFVDREIRRFQDSILSNSMRAAYLERLGWAYVAKSRAARDLGYLTLAAETASCLGELQEPEAWASATLLHAYVLHQQHRFEEAEIVARDLVKNRGLWLDYALLGDILLDRGRLEEATAHYQFALNQRPGPQVYSRAAQVRRLTGDEDGAIDMLAKAARASDIRDAESAVWSYVRLARWVWQRDGKVAADRLLDQALRIQPENPDALGLRGRLALSEGDVDQAIEHLERAVAASPTSQLLWLLLEAYEVAGKTGQQDLIARFRQQAELEDARTLALFLATRRVDVTLSRSLAEVEFELRQDVFTQDALAWALWANGDYLHAYNISTQALQQGTPDPASVAALGKRAPAGRICGTRRKPKDHRERSARWRFT
jgi:tetratricopeptide (TPR) repeat protein